MFAQEINLMFILSTLAALVLFGNGIGMFVSDKKNHVKQLYLVLMLLFSLWNIINAIMNVTKSVETALLLRNIAVFLCNLTYPTVLFFYILLANSVVPLKRFPRNTIILGYVLSFGYSAIIFFVSPYLPNTIKLTNLGWIYRIPNLDVAPERFYYFFILPFTIVMIYFTFKVLNNALNKRLLQIYKIITLGIAVTFMASLFTDVLMPSVRAYDILPLAAIFPVLPATLSSYAVYRYNYYSVSSLHVIKSVVDLSTEAFVLTEIDGRVAYLNKIAKQLFPALTVDGLFYESLDFSSFNTEETVFLINREQQQLVITNVETKDRLYYNYDKRVIRDSFDQPYAYCFLFRDKTESVKHENDVQIAYSDLENKIKSRTQNLMHKTEILNTYNRQLKRELEHRQKMETQIRELAYKDLLTGLNNRASFMNYLNKLFEKTFFSATHAIIFLDIVNFKNINDNLGHKFGDNVLMTVGSVLSEQFEDDNILARLSSDRFAILLEDYNSVDEISERLTQLLEVLSIPRLYDNLTLAIHFSVGIALFPQHGDSAENLINFAEIACREAKKLGKNKFLSFRPEYKQELRERFRTINSLKRAIADKELVIYYQPQIRVRNDSYHITGLEALVRWQHDGKLVAPSEFIHIAEYSKQIIEIGEYVIRQSIADISKINRDYNLALGLAINISAVQASDEGLYYTIKNAIEQYNFDPTLLEIELTESVLVSQVGLATSLLNELVNMGIRISVDDFGIEYSSLNYLKILPIDKIKLDISFVRGIGISQRDESIIETMITLAKRLNLNIIAEGVENSKQIEFLTEMNCCDMQGFYFYKPMTLDNLLEQSIIKAIDNKNKL